MQIPNVVFYEYTVVALALLYWGWKCLSLEVTGRDRIFRWTTSFWLTMGMSFFFLVGLVFPILGLKEGVAAFYALYAMPFLVGLIAFNVGYWAHVLVDSINCAPGVG